MSKRTRQSERRSIRHLTPVGVHVRSREEHWAEIVTSADASQTALASGVFDASRAELPGPRMVPVYRTAGGQTVTLHETPDGFVTRPYASSAPAELLQTGGSAGGYLAANVAPPLPIAAGASAMAWAQVYTRRVPEHLGLESQADAWAPATGTYQHAVADRTDPRSDEWRGRYFKRIREAARSRNGIYRGPEAVDREERYFTKDGAWNKQEYHQKSFERFRAAAEKRHADAAEARTATPRGTFDHSPVSRMLAFGAQLQKNGTGLGAALFEMLGPQFARQFEAVLQGDLAHKAATLAGRGGALDKLSKATDAINAMGRDDPRPRLAAQWKREMEEGAGRAGIFSPALADLQQKLIDQLGGKGDEDGAGPFLRRLVDLVGGDNSAGNEGEGGSSAAEALGQLAKLGSMFGDSGFGKAVSGGLQQIVDGEGDGMFAPDSDLLGDMSDKLIDGALDQLTGSVNDRSSMAKQLLAKYKDQIASALKKLCSADGLADFEKQWDATWKSMPSSATLPFGKAFGMCAPDLVMVNGVNVTRLNDECIYPPSEPPGKFFQGNPTILVNGMPPAGQSHAAINPKGTIATPEDLSTDVFMGEATVSLKVHVEVESPQAEAAQAAASSNGTSSDGTQAGETKDDDATASPPAEPQVQKDPTAMSEEEYDQALANAQDYESAAILALKRNNGDISKADKDIFLARRSYYDKKLREMGGDSSKLSDDQLRELHHPALTNADQYLEGMKQAFRCGLPMARAKIDKYNDIKEREYAGDPRRSTDNDVSPVDGRPRGWSPPHMGQREAAKKGLEDAERQGAGITPQEPLTCVITSWKELMAAMD